jgi:hypothetical protein
MEKEVESNRLSDLPAHIWTDLPEVSREDVLADYHRYRQVGGDALKLFEAEYQEYLIGQPQENIEPHTDSPTN